MQWPSEMQMMLTLPERESCQASKKALISVHLDMAGRVDTLCLLWAGDF
jgi:hypothetical protein